MDLQLQGDVAVVVGGARGIGRAVAERLAAEGCALAVVDCASEVQQTAATIAAAGGIDCRAFQVDISDEQAVARLADDIAHHWGVCHHVVCAAGVGSGKYGFPFWNVPPADWDRVWRVNVMGTVHVAHGFAPRLMAAGRGSLIFFSSVAAQIGSQTDPPYSAAKAAILNFAECAAKDLAPFGVRVNSICPGMVQTALNRDVWQAWHAAAPEAERQSYEAWSTAKIRQIAPLGRWQRAEEIAATVAFLVSPHAANMTGQAINIDGGQVMHW